MASAGRGDSAVAAQQPPRARTGMVADAQAPKSTQWSRSAVLIQCNFWHVTFRSRALRPSAVSACCARLRLTAPLLLCMGEQARESQTFADVVSLAELACKTRVRLQELPRALAASEASLASTAELLRLTSPVLAELEQSLDSALQSARLLPALCRSVVTARDTPP